MCIICLTHINQPLFIGTSARRLCRQKITKLRPSEWCTYIRSCLLVARKASDTPPHRCTSSWGPGLLATLPDWVSRVKTRSGTERRNQITPIDHLLPLHFSESPGHTPTKSKPCHHVRDGRAAQTGQPTETTAALFSRSGIPNRTSPCNAAATTHSHRPCDCNGRAARQSAGKAVRISLQRGEKVLP